MSFIEPTVEGVVYAPGYFLAHEECVRKTYEISDTGVDADANGGKHVPMGTVYVDGEDNVIGLLYEDVDVTAGPMPGSVVTKGVVYEDLLPEDITDVKSDLVALGFVFTTKPSVTRPGAEDDEDEGGEQGQ